MTQQKNILSASGIPVHCSHDKLMDVVDLVPHPRNPKKHPDKQIAMLAKIIRGQGWRAPVVVSSRSGFIVAGHARYEAAKLLQVESVPVNLQPFESEAQEHAHLVADNRIAELADIDEDVLKSLLSEIAESDLDASLSGFDDSEIESLISEDTETDYTKKIEAPKYEPTGEKPSLEEIFDASKTAELTNEIKNSSLTSDEKRFLEIAATRHTVFDFEKIAELYAHASPEMQGLMEKSGLVIIDFDKAIEFGFVQYTDAIAKIVKEEKNEE